MSSIAALLIYKAICLAVGAHAIWLGYRLFTKGITAPAGDLTGSFNKAQIAIKSGAPGVFFSVVGGFVICFTIVKGYSTGSNPLKNTGEFAISDTTEPVTNPLADSVAEYKPEHKAEPQPADTASLSKQTEPQTAVASADAEEIKRLNNIVRRQQGHIRKLQQDLDNSQDVPVAGSGNPMAKPIPPPVVHPTP